VSLAGSEAPALGEHAEVMMALHAQLAALLASNDAKLQEVGLVAEARCARLVSELYVAEHLLSLRIVKRGDSLKQAGERARGMAVRFALDRGALREVLREGHVTLQIVDEATWRRVLADLSVQVGELARRGDRAAAKELIDKLGAPPNPLWCSSAAERAKTLGVPSTFVLLPPRLKALRAEDGRLQDATLVESLSLTETALLDAGKLDAP
jgi:dipeptidyl-peptidase-3